MSPQKLNLAIRKWINKLRALLMSIMAADWSYEKAFYYITMGLILITLLLKAMHFIDASLNGEALLGTAILLCLTILASALLLAHGTRLLVRAIKKDMK